MVLTCVWQPASSSEQGKPRKPRCLNMDLVTTTQEQANVDVRELQRRIREAVSSDERGVVELHVNLHGLKRGPSMNHLRGLAAFMREMRPLLQRRLQKTTICVNSKVQRALLTLVFRLQKPVTPIEVQYAKNLA